MKAIYHVYEDSITEGLRQLMQNSLMILMGSISFALVAVLLRLGVMIMQSI